MPLCGDNVNICLKAGARVTVLFCGSGLVVSTHEMCIRGLRSAKPVRQVSLWFMPKVKARFLAFKVCIFFFFNKIHFDAH